MTDAVNRFAGKHFFTQREYSDAQHRVQMVGTLSAQLLAYNFAPRAYAYQVSAQGLSTSATSFSAFFGKHLDS